MSAAIDWLAIGRGVGEGLAHVFEATGLGNVVRDALAAIYGTCRVCDAPLVGASPEQICEECHAAEVLGRGGPTIGDA